MPKTGLCVWPAIRTGLPGWTGPRKQRLVVAGARLPVCGRGGRAESEAALERPPEVSDDELREPGEALALDGPLVAVDEEEKAEALAAAGDPELQRLADLELRVVRRSRFSPWGVPQ